MVGIHVTSSRDESLATTERREIQLKIYPPGEIGQTVFRLDRRFPDRVLTSSPFIFRRHSASDRAQALHFQVPAAIPPSSAGPSRLMRFSVSATWTAEVILLGLTETWG
jgi:hypothetical protein